MEKSGEKHESEPSYTIEPYDEGHVLVRPTNGSIASVVRIGSLNLPPAHYDLSQDIEPISKKALSPRDFAKLIFSRLSR